MDNAHPTLERPATPAADGAERLGTVAVGIEQPDGSVVIMIWDLPAALAEHELAHLTAQHGPAHSELAATAAAAATSADFLAAQHGVVRIDHD
ncbi:hypothetical protein FHS43_000548 [Streptosporangium becharense]|uniref:Uncharacterized protein n=1 Tax=Streptosporangium becharense TaxID=1816182 RepID=A0A7W9MK64_9ACTN|nr:hypothetical protein [Streptosporangium becharense]MBB2909302.1 hypothetical protein [Streptosporangium becharense]MBB5823795.1 hypothetical protein [Streptosporangium becharense]